jgi:hypothetical protein
VPVSQFEGKGMTHLNTEELITHLYGEGDKATHLEECAECAKAYAALKSDVAEMDFPEPPERDASYGVRVWASLAPLLVSYQSPRRIWVGGGLRRGFSFAVVCALLIACAFLGGRLWERKQTHSPTAIASNQKPRPVGEAAPPERIVVVVLSDHLDRSERLLMELKHANVDSTGLASPLRDEARTLLVANRICWQKAGSDDDPRLAPALERLNHLLEELANQSGSFNPVTLTRLQHDVNVDGLLFEVRVLRSGLPDRPTAATGHTKGDTI